MTLAYAPPPTALERPTASFRCRVRPSVKLTAAQARKQWPKAEAALELAELRLRRLAGPAVATLERLLLADSEAVQLGAANSLVDRGIGQATEKIQVAAHVTVRKPW